MVSQRQGCCVALPLTFIQAAAADRATAAQQAKAVLFPSVPASDTDVDRIFRLLTRRLCVVANSVLRGNHSISLDRQFRSMHSKYRGYALLFLARVTVTLTFPETDKYLPSNNYT
ncbi:hypothetical protein BZA77DRAFT_316448 [Pyronema omphalodes]|nr:hypothetical protein BZA77DRAFT_316448 [Pyronema omphalodes]